MSAAATSMEFREREARSPALHPPLVREVAGGVKEGGEEQEMRRRRRLLERFMASYGPGSQYLCEATKVYTHSCVQYTMRVSVKKARVSWSHRINRRFFPERRGSTFPIMLCRVAAGPDDRVEQVVDRSGAPGEPDQPGVVSGIYDWAYDDLELSRERGVIHKEGSLAHWTEVAVIRGMPGGRGITVTSHVENLVVQLHGILFLLQRPSATVDLCFSEHWFRLPAGWTEERLYAEDGFHIIDIAAPVENLMRKLREMHDQEEKEIERQRLETEEEREKRLLEEEVMRKREEEEKRKIRQRKEEERRIRDKKEAALSEISRLQHMAERRSFPRFKLWMNSNKQVSCKQSIKQEGLQDMPWRVEGDEYLVPISKPVPASASKSSTALEKIGFVEGYCDVQTYGLGVDRDRFMDRSGRTLSSVLMVSRSAAKVLTIVVRVHNLDILLDDGMVLSGGFCVSVDIHCDDASSSELLTKDWIYHIMCKNIDGEGMISFSSLLVHLKKKLNLQLRKQELGLIDDEEQNEDLAWRRQQELQKQKEWVLNHPKRELAEVELCDSSLLFEVGTE